MTLVRSDDLSTWTLDELAAVVNEEHDLALLAVKTTLRHVIRAGEALLAAKERVAPGGWYAWISGNTHLAETTVQTYMRLATYQAILPSHIETIEGARRFVLGLPKTTTQPVYPEEVKREARRLRKEGLSYPAIGEIVGAVPNTVRFWCDPRYQKQLRDRSKAVTRQRREANKALEEKRQAEGRAKAARKAGGALAESYSALRIAMQALDRAIEETPDRDMKATLRSALGHANKVEAKIVEALGVS